MAKLVGIETEMDWREVKNRKKKRKKLRSHGINIQKAYLTSQNSPWVINSTQEPLTILSFTHTHTHTHIKRGLMWAVSESRTNRHTLIHMVSVPYALSHFTLRIGYISMQSTSHHKPNTYTHNTHTSCINPASASVPSPKQSHLLSHSKQNCYQVNTPNIKYLEGNNTSSLKQCYCQ